MPSFKLCQYLRASSFLCRLPTSRHVTARSIPRVPSAVNRLPTSSKIFGLRHLQTAGTTGGVSIQPHPTPEKLVSKALTPILESITQSLAEDQITQKKLLLKLDDLISLPNTFAVVHIGGHQYKITKDDQIMIDSIHTPVQSRILLDKVLLLGSKEYTLIGQPMLTNVKVLAEVEEHEKTQKVIIFKKKRRKNYQRKTGHRQGYTLLRILDIMGAKVVPESPK